MGDEIDLKRVRFSTESTSQKDQTIYGSCHGTETRYTQTSFNISAHRPDRSSGDEQTIVENSIPPKLADRHARASLISRPGDNGPHCCCDECGEGFRIPSFDM